MIEVELALRDVDKQFSDELDSVDGLSHHHEGVVVVAECDGPGEVDHEHLLVGVLDIEEVETVIPIQGDQVIYTLRD